MRRDHDVIIAGAGPAGAQLALRLARAGWSVALLDARRFPRPKPCGEFLGPDCLPLLEELGLLAGLAGLGAQPVRRMELAGHGHRVGAGFRELGRTPLPYDHGYAVRRELLDEQALRAAERESGVRLFEGCAVGALLRDGAGGVLGVRAKDPLGDPFELRAPFTIGADGLRSRVARALGTWRPMRWLDRLALTTRARCEGLEGHSEVHFLPRGYVGLAPSAPELATINLVIDRRAAPRGRAELPGFFAAALELAPGLAGRIETPTDPRAYRTCGPFAARTRRQIFDGAALVGDAAGYVDPVTGEGMYFAMRGAALLARSLDRALHAGRTDARALRDYARAREREFGPRRAFALLLQRTLRREHLSAGVLALLEARPRVLELLLGLTGSGLSPRELLRPEVLLPALWHARAAPGGHP
jgi:menaquinone-9 beta-reductase